MSDWWSKKLAGEKPTAPRPSYTPPSAPIGFPQTQSTPMVNPQQVAQTAQPQSFSEALRMGVTNGGERQRKDGNITCPNCGGHYVFSRGKGNMHNGAEPAPRCYECGWNGLYDQGQSSNWG